MEQLRFIITILLVCCSLFNGAEPRERACNFRTIFNFGDSNSDTGGISAAFYPAGPPCGETFFHRPAGRGSDGRLIIDFIGNKLTLFFVTCLLIRTLVGLKMLLICSSAFWPAIPDSLPGLYWSKLSAWCKLCYRWCNC